MIYVRALQPGDEVFPPNGKRALKVEKIVWRTTLEISPNYYRPAPGAEIHFEGGKMVVVHGMEALKTPSDV